jgi:hypothetical protein
MKQRNPELKILFFMHSTLEKIIKVYCPSLITYSRDFLTIKDLFIKKTLMECEAITSVPLLSLSNRRDCLGYWTYSSESKIL